jgi:hypothetical protein
MGLKGARFFVLAAAAICSADAAAASAGAFQFVTGDVRLILANGAERPARKGTPIGTGDTVATARDSIAQIKMGDGGILVVQPTSRLTVVEFRYDGREDGSEKVVYRLEAGGFRAITGAIGHTNKDNYLIQTPIAHMGVRGTDHESYYFPAGASANGVPVQPGVYNKVNVGAAFIRNEAGEVVIRPSQAGYAASAKNAPGLLVEIPAFFNRASPPRQAQFNPVAVRVSTRTVPVEQNVTTTSGLNLSDPAASAAAPAAPAVPAVPVAPPPGTGSTVAYLQPSSANASSGVGLTIVPNGATLANAGGDTAFGVDWGTWLGGSPSVSGVDADPKAGVNFARSTQLTTAAQLAALPPGLVSATYSYLGVGGAVTNQDGAAGKISSLTVGVNFSTQNIDKYSMTATVPGGNWTANASSPNNTFAQFSSSSGIALTGSCDCTPATVKGSASGAFVGTAAERMITSFGLKANANNAISGAALLSR